MKQLFQNVLIVALFCLSGSVLAQHHTTVNVGEGAGGSTGPADSMGLVIPTGEIVIGTDTKAPNSTDSLYWNSGLHIEGPLNLMALPNLTESADDSVLLINTSGNVFKSVLGKNFFTSNGNATGNRAHDFDGFSLQISDISDFAITANNNWGFGTTANDIKINAITGLGMNIATTGSNLIQINSSTDLYLDATNDIILDAPDIILEDPLTLSTWDSVLVRHPTTGEIQARLASTITGSDSMGLVMPTGYLLMGRGDALPDTSSGLFWDGSKLGVGTISPSTDLHIINAANANFRVGKTTTEFFNILSAANTTQLTHYAGSGQSTFDINPSPADGTSTALFRFFRSTNTTGSAYFDIHLGDGTSGVNARIAGKGANTFLAANNGSVGIGTTSPAASAKLDVSSTTQGLKIPTMTSTQRDAISSPAAGIIIYNTTTTKLEIYNGSWTAVH